MWNAPHRELRGSNVRPFLELHNSSSERLKSCRKFAKSWAGAHVGNGGEQCGSRSSFAGQNNHDIGRR
eukprot:14237973-Alexandrium_andersonii.AAC.1